MKAIAAKGRNPYYEGLFPGEEKEDAEARRSLVHERDELVADLKACAEAHAVEEKENEHLRKLASQRGARMQIMWEWMREARPSESYDRVLDQFLWNRSDCTYANWFNDTGVPVDS